MSYSPGYVEPPMTMVSILGPWSPLYLPGATTAPASSAWAPTNNTGVWFAMPVPTVCVAKRMWWLNGATVNAANNIESGIYLDGGHKPGAKLITTGSVAQGNASELQFADITDVTLSPGLYWLFLSCSTTAATFLRVSLGAQSDETYKFQQGSIGPGSAPATATPAESASNTAQVFGFSTTTIT